MTTRNPKTPAPARPPVGGAAGPCANSQGSRLPPSLTPAVAEGGPDVPAAEEAGSVLPAVGRKSPEGGAAGPGEGAPRRSRPPGSTEALSGEAFRKAMRAAQSAKAKTQRQQRARPWSKRDPYAKAVPGGRKPPPGGDAA